MLDGLALVEHSWEVGEIQVRYSLRLPIRSEVWCIAATTILHYLMSTANKLLNNFGEDILTVDSPMGSLIIRCGGTFLKAIGAASLVCRVCA